MIPDLQNSSFQHPNCNWAWSGLWGRLSFFIGKTRRQLEHLNNFDNSWPLSCGYGEKPTISTTLDDVNQWLREPLTALNGSKSNNRIEPPFITTKQERRWRLNMILIKKLYSCHLLSCKSKHQKSLNLVVSLRFVWIKIKTRGTFLWQNPSML